MSKEQQEKLLEHFVAGATARAAGQLVGVQAKTAIQFYQRLRQLIASKLAISIMSSGRTLLPGQTEEIPVDLNDYFDFTQAGIYQFRGSYYFEIVSTKGILTPLWDDFATGDFSLQIKDAR